MTPTRRIFIAVIVLLGVVRLAVFAAVYANNPQGITTPDTADYESAAESLATEGRFILRNRLMVPSQSFVGVAETFRTPGYPAFIAAVYLVFGPNPVPVVVLQVLLSLLSVIALWEIARRLFSERHALAAVSLAALDPDSLRLSHMVLSETLFTTLLMLTLWAGVLLLTGEAGRLRNALLLGLGLAAATLVRPITYYLVYPVVGLVLLALIQRSAGLRETLAVFGVIALVWVVLIGGWQLRNYRVTGSKSYTSIVSANLIVYKAVDVMMERDGIPPVDARLRVLARLPDLRDASAAERERAYTRVAMDVIRDEPLLLAKTQLRGSAVVALFPGQPQELQKALGLGRREGGPLGDLRRLSPSDWARRWIGEHPGLLLAFVYSVAYLAVLYAGLLGAAVSVLRAPRIPHPAHLLLVGVALYLLLLSGGGAAAPRFRVPIIPLLALYSGLGWMQFRERFWPSRPPGDGAPSR